ncbi:MAG: PD-(D/E)XK motif protein [Bosea sp. (in: a-proteobacteria)]|uniref:PD-(D/E)XK motif protein n=1 Tax=Bosea sp. (in: a-proteobacteria) TaxID=1871050 RepID=UPI002732CA9B|nr:PD-(D/E)XK motif protein [Bosea sp. (in: a-proteobacteria)]MDP3600962.1 PD-(D/E)XK motif protein [Bosea sp. (in: a-proteobacteria)]
MIPIDTPWSGLEAGKVDTRRASASARWNWFWALMPRADAALVLRLTELPASTSDLPTLRNLEIRFQTLSDGPLLYIRLKDNAQLELFETLCRDVMGAGELCETEGQALERAIRRTFRWHYLLRGGKQEILSEDSQKGLIGEIQILKLLISTVGAKAALAAWTGPSGAPKDFELKEDCIEVKARRGASQPFVKISNEYQLTDVSARRLWLAVLAVDKVQQPHGKTLTEEVVDLTDLLERSEPSAIMDWDLHLADAGYDSLHDYSAWRWMASSPDFHAVTEGFPRIVAPVPLGLSGVTYTLGLSACAPFRADWNDVRSGLVIEDQE